MQAKSSRACVCGCGGRVPPGRARLLPGHRWRDRYAPPQIRFWRHVDYGGPGCWRWRGAVSHGYGSFAVVPDRQIHASRAIWIMLHGEPGPGMIVMHRCDDKLCVRPSHLEAGTHARNHIDYYVRIGRDFSGYRRGERNNKARLTAEQVQAIRSAACRPRTDDIRRLARRYGVTRDLIYQIRKRLIWRHVE